LTPIFFNIMDFEDQINIDSSQSKQVFNRGNSTFISNAIFEEQIW